MNKHYFDNLHESILLRSKVLPSKVRPSILLRSSVLLILSALIPSIAHAIEAPRDTRGTVVRSAEIKWEWAGTPGAVQYQVNVNGAFVSMTNDIFFYSRNLSPGDYTFTVQAVDSNNRYSSPSVNSAVRTIGSGSNGNGSNGNGANTRSQGSSPSGALVSIPTNVSGTQVGDREARWEWSAVPGATGYQIYLDGKSAGVTQDDYIHIPNLSGSDHSVKVAAIDSNGKHTDQSLVASVSIGGNFAQGGNSAPPPPSDDNGLIDPASWNYREVSQKPGYQLVFSDEFNSNTLNRARWNTQLRWDGSYNGERYEYRLINGESQFYVNTYSQDPEHLAKVATAHNPFEFDGNRLAIRAVKNPLKDRDTKFTYGPLDSIYRQQPFLSGVISSYDHFFQKYGYFEARIKIPAHMGTFPAFWLHHQRTENENTQKTEIDIMENLGHNPQYVYNALHYYTNVTPTYGGAYHRPMPQPNGQVLTGTIYSDDYHVYAVEWEPGLIRFLIDGQQVNELRGESAFNHEELYIILNLAVGGNWTNDPINAGGNGRSENNQFPNQQDLNEWSNPALEIDYVRAYKAQ